MNLNHQHEIHLVDVNYYWTAQTSVFGELTYRATPLIFRTKYRQKFNLFYGRFFADLSAQIADILTFIF